MEREAFFSGYCRAIDASRTVAVEVDGQAQTWVDCSYPDCPHVPNCPVAKEITAFIKDA